jgi:hypothetical protein
MPKTKPKKPPKQFAFRGVKFTLRTYDAFYRHRDPPGLRIMIWSGIDGWIAEVRSTAPSTECVVGSYIANDPQEALAQACRALELNAKDRIRHVTRDMEPSLKIARAKAWR